jgi:hypothetical protein
VPLNCADSPLVSAGVRPCWLPLSLSSTLNSAGRLELQRPTATSREPLGCGSQHHLEERELYGRDADGGPRTSGPTGDISGNVESHEPSERIAHEKHGMPARDDAGHGLGLLVGSRWGMVLPPPWALGASPLEARCQSPEPMKPGPHVRRAHTRATSSGGD